MRPPLTPITAESHETPLVRAACIWDFTGLAVAPGSAHQQVNHLPPGA